MVICSVCHKESSRGIFVRGRWYCKFDRPAELAMGASPNECHVSAGNHEAPNLTKAKDKVFTNSVRLSNGDVIDRRTGKEPAY